MEFIFNTLINAQLTKCFLERSINPSASGEVQHKSTYKKNTSLKHQIWVVFLNASNISSCMSCESWNYEDQETLEWLP